MEKSVFLKKIKEWLDLEGEVNENTSLHITSIETLSIIAFIDKNFDKQINPLDLKSVSSINDLMKLINLE
jgi:acyl carrier protein